MPASIIQFSEHCLSLPFGEFAKKTVIYDAAGIEILSNLSDIKSHLFILGLNINDARYPNINAALIPTALALNPPRNTPMNPS